MRLKIELWTATTEGDNCPLSTTVHADEASARQRIIDDMTRMGRPPLGDVTGNSYALAQAWGNKMDGGCIIERHELKSEQLAMAA